MKKIISSVILTMTLMFGMVAAQTAIVTPNTVTYADDLGKVMDQIQNSNSVIGDQTKNKVLGLSNDVQQIIIVIAVAVLSCTGVLTAIKFANAGDDSSSKAKLKTALIFQIGGIIFLASYLGMMKFGFDYLKLFE